MAWQTSKRVWEHASDIKQSEKLVLLALAEKSDEHGVCWPGYDTIADMAGIERRSAIRLVASLKEKGHIWIREQVGRGNSNTYYVISGLTESDIVCTLTGHPELGIEQGQALLEARAISIIRLKGDSQGTIYNKGKGDTQGINGDTGVLKGDSQGIKGDSQVTRTNKEPSVNHQEPSDSSPPSKKKNPAKIPKPPKKPSEADLANRAMFAALANLCRYDTKKITDKIRGAISQSAKILRNDGVTPADLEQFGIWWYANDWRGQKGQAPRPDQVRDEWGQFENRDKARQNGHHKNTATNQTSISGLREKGSDNPVKKRFNPTTGETYWVDIRTNQRVPAPDSA